MKTITLELTKEESKMLLLAAWLRAKSLKEQGLPSAKMYFRLLSKMEKQGVQI